MLKVDAKIALYTDVMAVMLVACFEALQNKRPQLGGQAETVR
jgi:hypothetical protein